jgi:hypothetical protein
LSHGILTDEVHLIKTRPVMILKATGAFGVGSPSLPSCQSGEHGFTLSVDKTSCE